MRKTALSLEEKHYDPSLVEESIYALWEGRNCFKANNQSEKPAYSMVIPPPNVTGRLHMGHALNNTIQDTLARFKRMDGFDVLWVPGTDHAGIATQSVVKKQLDSEGIDHRDLGREKMVERIWLWKEKFGDQILNQLRRLGCSCDWSRVAFTMDEKLSRAVKVAFKKMYDAGLIYRGKYIVNWCPVDRTALSDDEIDIQDGGEAGHLWHFRYPLEDNSGFVTIATTRPETLLGDVAIAVNPKDSRYSKLVGKKVRLPLVGRLMPIIVDDFVDVNFGSGCVKITPAHDLNDFQVGLRHGLEPINVMNEDGSMGDQAPQRYHGIDRFACRDLIVKEMEKSGLIVKIEDRMVPVGRSYRSKAIIEYRLSDQWFVKMQPLAKIALEVSQQGKIKFFPERWDPFYRDWLVKTRDWCISRQIWWGHRIPAWHNKKTGEVLVDLDTPAAVKASPADWYQDEDVLDTWFSSALWPYSTMGWPDNTKDLERYYPTSVLSTAKDIIFFWVARMVMTGLFNVGKIPFSHVVIHPVVCDEEGETMSKSKGNGIDPLHVISGATKEELAEPIFEARPSNMEELLARLNKRFPDGFKGVGADALRFTLLTLSSDAQQVQLSLARFDEIGRRFIDKLWNASRFALQNFTEVSSATVGQAELQIEDRWILGSLDRCVAEVRSAVEQYRFHSATEILYRFFWDDLCDWYLELIKSRLKEGTPAERRSVQQTLGEVLSAVLRLLHPIVPYITEEIWAHLYERLTVGELIDPADAALKAADLCINAPYPRDRGRFDAKLDSSFRVLQEILRAVRNMRANAGLSPKTALELQIRPANPEIRKIIESGESIIKRGAVFKSIIISDQMPEKRTLTVLDSCEVFLNLAEHLDVGAETKRHQAELKKVEAVIESVAKKLSNQDFISRAAAHVVEGERKKLEEAKEKRLKIEASLKELASIKV